MLKYLKIYVIISKMLNIFRLNERNDKFQDERNGKVNE